MFGTNPYSPYGYAFPGPGMSGQNAFAGAGSFQAPPVSAGGPDWIMVPSVKDVAQVSVQPGGKAWVMSQNEPVFALRTADNMGLVSTAYYRFEKYEPGAEAPEAPAGDFVTRKEFEEFVSSFRKETEE